MDNPVSARLEELSKETLIELVKLHSLNWITCDGLWFSGVEEKFGHEAALELDYRMWRIGSKVEARRIKELFNLGPGLDDFLKAIDLLSWAYTVGYKVERSDEGALWTVTDCPPQRNRVAQGIGEFACRPTFESCFNNLAQELDPSIKVECRFCPPGEHPEGVWCQWFFRGK